MDLREEMIGLVEEFNNCGMTQIAFCNSKGISFHKFNHWFRKLKKGKKGEMERHQFVQVDTKPVKISDERIELVYPNGVKINLSTGDIELVSRLVKVF